MRQIFKRKVIAKMTIDLKEKWILDWTGDLGAFCNNHPSNRYAYNIYLITCKLINWL